MKILTKALFVVILSLSGAGVNLAQTPAPKAKLLITNALLLTMVPGQEKPFTGYIVVGNDETITAIGTGSPPSDLTATTTYKVAGKWIIPGFFSAHSHLWQSAYRRLATDKELDGWLTVLYVEHAPKSKVEDFYWFTLDGALDHLRHGI